MTRLTKIINELGFASQIDEDCLLIYLPDTSHLKVVKHSVNPILHLQMPEAAERYVKRSFDITPTAMGDYLVDEKTLRKILSTLSKQFESEIIRASRDNIAELASDMQKMAATEQMSESIRRLGQDRLRTYLLERFGSCQVSGVHEKDLLVASHIKPWSQCKNGPDERLDTENVLLLAANWDSLFDKYLISFDSNTGRMLKSARVDDYTLRKFGVPDDWMSSIKIDVKTKRRKTYLAWHNDQMKILDGDCDK